jgi:hypothetical protein
MCAVGRRTQWDTCKQFVYQQLTMHNSKMRSLQLITTNKKLLTPAQLVSFVYGLLSTV